MEENNKVSENEKLAWETPELEALGQIGDVAAGAGPNTEGALPSS